MLAEQQPQLKPYRGFHPGRWSQGEHGHEAAHSLAHWHRLLGGEVLCHAEQGRDCWAACGPEAEVSDCSSWKVVTYSSAAVSVILSRTWALIRTVHPRRLVRSTEIPHTLHLPANRTFHGSTAHLTPVHHLPGGRKYWGPHPAASIFFWTH